MSIKKCFNFGYRSLRLWSVLIGIVLGVSVNLWAAFPSADGFVVDQTGTLSTEQKNQLISLSQSIEHASGIQLATAVVASLDDMSIEEYANRLFEQWGVGSKDKNNGVLFVVAPNERRVRIEVGYGLEGDLPDGKTGEILDQAVIPYFKAGKVSDGIFSGHVALAQFLITRFDLKMETPQPPPVQQAHRGIGIFDILIILFLLSLLFNRRFRGGLLGFLTGMAVGGMLGGSGRHHNNRFGGFGSGGGFGGFGGGLSGGGGSSRSW